MDGRLAKMELVLADAREGMELIEQRTKKGMKDLREHIQDLHGRVLVSQVQPLLY